MNDDDLHLWSGLYATDALTPDERARYEDHLARCAECREEVAGFHDTAALLAAATAATPPPDVRAKVLARVAATRQDPPAPAVPEADTTSTSSPDAAHLVVPIGRPAPRRIPRWLLAAAALVLVLGGLGILLAGRHTGSASEAEQVAAVLARADARIITLKGEDRAPLKLVWSPSRGEGALLADDLAAIDDAETYELWAIADGKPAQVALFRPDERGVVRSHFTTDLRDADAVGVTIEPAGGSAAPTTPIVLSSTVS